VAGSRPPAPGGAAAPVPGGTEAPVPDGAAGPAPGDASGRTPPGRRAARARQPASWPLRAQDAFFLHVETPTDVQQIGTVMELGPRPDGRPVTRADVTGLLARRLPAITTLRRRLVDRGRWRRPGWVVDRSVDPEGHVDGVHVPAGDDGGAAVDRFWSEPLPTDRPPWRMLLVGGLPDGRTRLAVKLHHSLGDGLSVIAVLQRLLDPADDAPKRAARSGPAPGGAPTAARPAPTAERRVSGPAREAARQVGRTVRGLARLATQGPAPRTPLNRRVDSPRRRLLSTSLPAADVLRAARACRAHPSELMVALTAAALGEAHPAPAPPRLRAMFPVSRDRRRRAPTQGNWTGAVTLDLPLGSIPTRDRVAGVRRALRDALSSGEPEAAGMVMRAMGLLPAPLHGALARRVYTSRRLNVVVSYVPAHFHPRLLAGAPVRSAAPVVALAEGVHLGICLLRCGSSFDVGVILNEALADVGEKVVAALRSGLAELLAEAGAEREDQATAEAPAGAAAQPAGAAAGDLAGGALMADAGGGLAAGDGGGRDGISAGGAAAGHVRRDVGPAAEAASGPVAGGGTGGRVRGAAPGVPRCA
ncbi:wax ester/triacylglycerol synthase domain-containing protein, partial [Micromonospora costi]|uniref:wax ester/triacylglycerol synthase domain-containing protein n=1 Tax=Micromonospora costi TaxID=1530042 RepID=UPI003411CC61